MHKVEQCDRDAAARCLGYADWGALMNPKPRDSSGVVIVDAKLRWRAERAAEQVAAHRIATIERCAGVAERCPSPFTGTSGFDAQDEGFVAAIEDIAAAIRDLKGGA